METDETTSEEIIDVTNKEVIECLEKLQKNILIRKIVCQSHSNGSVSLTVLKTIFSIILYLKKVQMQLDQYFDFNLNN